MKKRAILVFVILHYIVAVHFAQKTFYTSIDPEPMTSIADYGNIIVEGTYGGWVISVRTHCFGRYMDCYNLIETNEWGELINQSHLPTINIRTMVKMGDYYYGVSSIYDSTYDNQVVLNKFNLDLELVDQAEYGGINSEYGDKIIIGNDDHLVITGNVKNIHSDTLQIELFILEYDTNLKLIKDTILPHSSKVVSPTTLTRALDKGFLLNYTVFDPIKWNWIMANRAGLTKLDEEWNIEWEVVTSDGANFPNYKPQILSTNDGFIMQWTKDSTITINGERILYWPYIVKMDKNGNKIWRHDMIKSRTPVSITKIINAKNGDILGCGAQEINNNQKTIGWIFRMDTHGTILWQRWFERPFDGIESSVVFKDMIEMNNGRLALTGFWFDTIAQSEQIDGNVGLFVLDSNGCLVENCPDKTILTAIDQPMVFDNFNPIQVFPNPSTDVLNIYIDGWKNNLLSINIYSLDGHLVLSKKVKFISDLLQIEHQLSVGVYLLKIRSTNKLLLNQKLVITG